VRGTGDVDTGGPPGVDELRSSDELFDRLGRRAPGPSDLDDPLIATLAVLAGDVDLLPVPVSASRRALTGAGAWPVAALDAPLNEAGGPGAVPSWFTTASLPRPSVPARLPAGPTPSTGRPARSGHPRVLRLRPSAGVVVAAALVLVGGGVAAVVTMGNRDPLAGISSVVDPGGSSAHPLTRAGLVDRVEAARAAVRHGDLSRARRILDEVDDQLSTLAPADRQAVATRVAGVERELATASPSASGSGRAGGRSGAPATEGAASGVAGAAGTTTGTRGSGATEASTGTSDGSTVAGGTGAHRSDDRGHGTHGGRSDEESSSSGESDDPATSDPGSPPPETGTSSPPDTTSTTQGFAPLVSSSSAPVTTTPPDSSTGG